MLWLSRWSNLRRSTCLDMTAQSPKSSFGPFFAALRENVSDNETLEQTDNERPNFVKLCWKERDSAAVRLELASPSSGWWVGSSCWSFGTTEICCTVFAKSGYWSKTEPDHAYTPLSHVVRLPLWGMSTSAVRSWQEEIGRAHV